MNPKLLVPRLRFELMRGSNHPYYGVEVEAEGGVVRALRAGGERVDVNVDLKGKYVSGRVRELLEEVASAVTPQRGSP